MWYASPEEVYMCRYTYQTCVGIIHTLTFSGPHTGYEGAREGSRQTSYRCKAHREWYIYIYMYTNIIYTQLFIDTHTCTYIYTCTSLYMYIYTYIYMYIYVYIAKPVTAAKPAKTGLYICIYTHHICIYTCR